MMMIQAIKILSNKIAATKDRLKKTYRVRQVQIVSSTLKKHIVTCIKKLIAFVSSESLLIG